MEIIFSRHAKRRMQLYNIEENDIRETIKAYLTDKELQLGKQQVINRNLADKYKYPLKIYFSKENDRIVVITTYPLRKERQP